MPWEKVLELNAAFCQAQRVPAQVHDGQCSAVKAQWESAGARTMTLAEALDLCRQANLNGPFVFNNANTFAAVAKSLVDHWAKGLPPVEATMLRTTVSHYAADRITKKELVQVMRYLDPYLRPAAQAAAPAIPAGTFIQPGAV
jgi:hypothetical protein